MGLPPGTVMIVVLIPVPFKVEVSIDQFDKDAIHGLPGLFDYDRMLLFGDRIDTMFDHRVVAPVIAYFDVTYSIEYGIPYP